jgi:hypothetical protein
LMSADWYAAVVSIGSVARNPESQLVRDVGAYGRSNEWGDQWSMWRQLVFVVASGGSPVVLSIPVGFSGGSSAVWDQSSVLSNSKWSDILRIPLCGVGLYLVDHTPHIGFEPANSGTRGQHANH